MTLNVVGLLHEINAVVDVDISAPVENFEYLGDKITFEFDSEDNQDFGCLCQISSFHHSLDMNTWNSSFILMV